MKRQNEIEKACSEAKLKKEVQLLNANVKILQAVAGQNQEVVSNHQDTIESHEYAIFREAEFISAMSAKIEYSDMRRKDLVAKVKEQEGTIHKLKGTVRALTAQLGSLKESLDLRRYLNKKRWETLSQKTKKNEDALNKFTSKKVDKQYFGEDKSASKVNVEKLKEIITALRDKVVSQEEKIQNIVANHNTLAKIALKYEDTAVNIVDNGPGETLINDHDIDLIGDVA